MIVFFGLRSARIESRKLDANTTCEHCNSENSFIASVYGNYFHVFWIPIFSTGKAIVVECNHCKKTYHLKDLSPDNQKAVQNSFNENPPKKAKWLNLGCFVILGFVFLFICLAVYSIILSSFNDDYEDNYDTDYPTYEESKIDGEKNDDEYVIENPDPKWIKTLKKDLLESELYPNKEEEPVSYALQQCLDTETLGLGEDDIGYYYKVNDDEVLILLQPWNLSKLNEKEKNAFYKKIDHCLDIILKDENYKRFIGVYDQHELKMQKTPKGMVKDSTAKSSELLKDFYNKI